jgi:hypothetical protein
VLSRLMSFHKNENLMPLKEPTDKTRISRTLLKSQALSYFEHHLNKRLDAQDLELPDIELVFRELCIGKQYIPKRATCVQKY